MAASIVVTGFTPSVKDPGFKAVSIIPGGKTTSSLWTRSVLCVGLMGTGSTATAELVYPILNESDITKFGVKGELALMLYKIFEARSATAGATLYAAGIATVQGAVGGTWTLTVSGTWTTAGAYRFYIDGKPVDAVIGASDSTTDAATAIKNAINATIKIPITATSNAAVVTATVDSAGARGAYYYIVGDSTGLPSGAAVAISGGTPVTGGAVPPTGASGADSVATLLTNIYPAKYDRIAVAQSDSTNLGRWKTQINNKAGVLEGRLEHIVFATNGALATAGTLSTSTLNDPRFTNLWQLYGESHPSEVAAVFAAIRAVTESSNPSPRYIYTALPTIAPNRYTADWPQESTRDAALNEGVTPIATSQDGTAYVVRGITSYCRFGGNADDRVLDLNQIVMPDYARERFEQIWTQDISPVYPHVRDSLSADEPDPPAGVLYPELLAAELKSEMKKWEAQGWVVSVDAQPLIVQYSAAGRRLLADAVIVPTPINAQLGMNIRQSSVV